MQIGKLLMFAGGILLVLGLFISFSNRIPFLGKLPGDFTFEIGNTKIFFPLTTSILLSILLSIIIFVINRLRG